MPFLIVRNDITEMQVDAIVNSSNRHLIGAGGTDGVIHRKAGPELDRACEELGGCEAGEAKATPGFCLPCRYIIHTVTPVWRDGLHQEEEKLAGCYLHSLQLAEKLGCESVAFPLMASGINGFPKGEALRIANDAIRSWLEEHDLDIYLVVYDRKSFLLSEKLQRDIHEYIDDHYVQDRSGKVRNRNLPEQEEFSIPKAESFLGDIVYGAPIKTDKVHHVKPSVLSELSKHANVKWKLDESFSEMLLRKIDEKGMSDSQCYKRANVDRKLFSKIRCDPKYHPAKMTVMALGIALKLSIEELEELLQKAGYALSDSQLGDVIIKYFLSRNNYDMFEINEALYAEDQQILYGK